ncbi:MAG: adenylate/guanylate cyclase domain-containing protein [Verrucomicrobiales bacterium]|nr:adenylate/guanylate cyclase domain-containing protein [Verrucomicrobiales bacterium]
MRRYALTALLIGSLVAAAVLGLYFTGVFEGPAAWLGETYRGSGFFPDTEMSRVGWLEILLITVTSLGVAWCLVDIPQLGHKILVFMTILVVLMGLSPTFALYGKLFEPFSCMTAALLAATAGIIYAGTELGMRKRVLQNVLGPRVSRTILDEMMSAPEPPDFSGAVREVSVLTVRVFNDGDLREKMEPTEVLKMSNLFLRSTSDFLKSKGGYLDESGPDLVRVFFGMLKPSETHAEEACRAALELRTRLQNLNQECETRWFHRLQFGVAVSSGSMTVGVYGSPQHYFYSGVGAETDFSRRLAHANLRYDSDVLISARTFLIVSDKVEVRPMEMFYDPDEDVMSEIYQILAMKEQFTDEERQRRDQFWQGVIFYREAKYEEALDLFSRARVPGVEDGPVNFFIERTQGFLTNPDQEHAEDSYELTDEGHARLLGMM